MAHPQIAVFARLADGGAKRVRKLEGQKTLLGGDACGCLRQRFMTNSLCRCRFLRAILTFRGGADGQEAPIRAIQGPLTQLASADRLAVDPMHNEIFVPSLDQVLVFSREANGNVAPLRVLKGPDTQLKAPRAVAVDPVRNFLVVGDSVPYRASNRAAVQKTARFVIFDRTDQGNVKPKAIIGGPKTDFHNVSGPFAVYPPRGWIIAADSGGGAESLASDQSYVGVWSIEDNGDVPPRWRIRGPERSSRCRAG